jgi:hypothetical protein
MGCYFLKHFPGCQNRLLAEPNTDHKKEIQKLGITGFGE